MKTLTFASEIKTKNIIINKKRKELCQQKIYTSRL